MVTSHQVKTLASEPISLLRCLNEMNQTHVAQQCPLGCFWVQYYSTYNILVANAWYINFGYQFWFLGAKIINFTKKMLQNIILKIIFLFIIYIERSMGIFIVYVGIIGSLSHFKYTNFKVSFVIKIINFSAIKKRPICLSTSM